MSVMTGRLLARRSASRQDTEDTSDDLAEAITEVVTELFPELLIEALADPQVRLEIHKVLAVNRRTASPVPARRAAEIKRGRR